MKGKPEKILRKVWGVGGGRRGGERRQGIKV